MSTSSMPNPPLTDPEVRELIRRSQCGDLDAKEAVILKYLPLAYTYAEKYKEYGVPLEDLTQEACYGLLVALDRYDGTQKAKFTTYAHHYMKKYIRDALLTQNNNLAGCYDRDFYRELKTYMQAVAQFKQENGRLPSNKDMADKLKISLWRIERLRKASYSFMAPSVNIDDIANSYVEGGIRPLEDSFLDRFEYMDLKKQLTPREAEVLDRRFGFTESGEPEKWEFISASMGYCVDTLQMSYQKGIYKLRKALGVETKNP